MSPELCYSSSKGQFKVRFGGMAEHSSQEHVISLIPEGWLRFPLAARSATDESNDDAQRFNPDNYTQIARKVGRLQPSISTMGPPLMAEGSWLRIPQGSLCLPYCAMAAKDPQSWERHAKNAQGFLMNRAIAQQYKEAAEEFLARVRQLMYAAGEPELAKHVGQRGKPSGQDDLNYYALALGGSIEVVPITLAVHQPVKLYGAGPLAARLGHATNAGGRDHFILLQSWIPGQNLAQIGKRRRTASPAMMVQKPWKKPRLPSTTAEIVIKLPDFVIG